MLKRKISFILISIVLVVATLVTFNLNKDDNNTLKEITVAEVTHSVFYTPFYVAIENGYFKDLGIDINLLLTPGADKVSAAVLSGDAEVGLAGAESAIYIYKENKDDYLQIFSGLTAKDGQFIVSRKKMKNFEVKDLIGKEVLAGRSTGMPALNFINSLDNFGVNKKDVNINTSIDFAALSGAFIGGQGDYVNLFEPTATFLEKQGYGYIVASVGDLSGEVPYTTFYSKKSYLDNNKDILINFTSAINKGIEYTLNNDSKKIARDIISQFPDLNINDLSLMIQRYKESKSWLEDPYVTEKTFENLEDFLVKFDLLKDTGLYNKVVYNLYE